MNDRMHKHEKVISTMEDALSLILESVIPITRFLISEQDWKAMKDDESLPPNLDTNNGTLYGIKYEIVD